MAVHEHMNALKDITPIAAIQIENALGAVQIRTLIPEQWSQPGIEPFGVDDTGFLMEATPRSVTAAVDLVGALGDRSADLPPLLDRSPAPGEQSARALGTLRATGYRAGDLFVAVTHVGGYETAAAHALRDAGIDLVVVCSEQADGLRVTARASEAFVERQSLGSDVLPVLADEFGGDGGGHAGAGVADLQEVSVDAVESFLIAHLESELGLTFATVGRV